jgi:GNAT superfamily N-acetyltransferase
VEKADTFCVGFSLYCGGTGESWVSGLTETSRTGETLKDLHTRRMAIRPLLAPSDPGDALTAYYALYHNPRRTQLMLHHAPSGDADGFVAVCQTGQDLFRPVVVIRAPDEDAAGDLFRRALLPGRPYYVIALLDLGGALERFLDMPSPAINRVYRVDPACFSLTRRSEINVLVQEIRGPEGQLRWEIRSGGQVAVAAGTNWRSPFCAELYVYVEPAFQGRGWGRAVVRAATVSLLGEGLLPLYMVEETNLPSILLAEAVGYTDTGRREIAGQASLRPI